MEVWRKATSTYIVVRYDDWCISYALCRCTHEKIQHTREHTNGGAHTNGKHTHTDRYTTNFSRQSNASTYLYNAPTFWIESWLCDSCILQENVLRYKIIYINFKVAEFVCVLPFIFLTEHFKVELFEFLTRFPAVFSTLLFYDFPKCIGFLK